MRSLLQIALLLAGLAVLLGGCIPRGIVKDRLDVIEDKVSCGARASTLVVLLPGAYDTPRDFVLQGFVSDLRQRRIAADVVAADTHFGYYQSGIVARRLHQDIIAPAAELGYRQIWLVGISLGGYGSLLYARQHPERIAGVLLLAPYLGSDSLAREIANAGGLAAWQAGDARTDDDDRALWRWLQAYPARPHPPLYLGFGLEDRFAGINRMLAGVLPAAQVTTTEGGHDWAPWRRLWDAFLDRGVLPRCP